MSAKRPDSLNDQRVLLYRELFCRICLQYSKDSLIPGHAEIKNTTLFDMFIQLTTFELDDNDAFPVAICEQCVSKLTLAYNIREEFIAQTELLLKLVVQKQIIKYYEQFPLDIKPTVTQRITAKAAAPQKEPQIKKEVVDPAPNPRVSMPVRIMKPREVVLPTPTSVAEVKSEQIIDESNELENETSMMDFNNDWGNDDSSSGTSLDEDDWSYSLNPITPRMMAELQPVRQVRRKYPSHKGRDKQAQSKMELDRQESRMFRNQYSTTTCHICDQKHDSIEQRDDHFRMHIHMLPYECGECLADPPPEDPDLPPPPEPPVQQHIVLRSVVQLNSHLMMHRMPYNCEHCYRRFMSKYLLQHHTWNYHEHAKEGLTCEWCGKRYFSRRPFQEHVRRHRNSADGSKLYRCKHVDCTFTSPSSTIMSQHRLRHNKPCVCEICGQRFVSPKYTVHDHAPLPTCPMTSYPTSAQKTLLQRFCRLCLRETPFLLPFNAMLKEVTLADMLDRLLGAFRMKQTADLPNGICTTCLTKLDYAYNAQKEFVRNEQRLRHYHQHGELLEKLFAFQSHITTVRERSVAEMIAESGEEALQERIKIDPKLEVPGMRAAESSAAAGFKSVVPPGGWAVMACDCPSKPAVPPTRRTTRLAKPVHPLLKRPRRNRAILRQAIAAENPTGTSAASIDPCKCYICDSVMDCEQALRDHLVVHVDMLPYACAECTETPVASNDIPTLITSLAMLQRHFRMHSYPLKCPHCPQRFRQHTSVYTHVRYRHEMFDNPEGYTCDVCGVTIRYRPSFMYHIRMHHHEQRCTHVASTYQAYYMHRLRHEMAHRCEECEEDEEEEEEVVEEHRVLLGDGGETVNEIVLMTEGPIMDGILEQSVQQGILSKEHIELDGTAYGEVIETVEESIVVEQPFVSIGIDEVTKQEYIIDHAPSTARMEMATAGVAKKPATDTASASAAASPDRFCRICLLKRPNLTSLMERVDGVMIPEMLYKLCGRQIEVQEGYPRTICQRCLCQLDCAYRFLTEFHQQDERLRSFYWSGSVGQRLREYQDEGLEMVDKRMDELIDRNRSLFAPPAKQLRDRATNTEGKATRPKLVDVGVCTDVLEAEAFNLDVVKTEAAEETTVVMEHYVMEEEEVEQPGEDEEEAYLMLSDANESTTEEQLVSMKIDVLREEEDEEDEQDACVSYSGSKRFRTHPSAIPPKVVKLERTTSTRKADVADSVDETGRTDTDDQEVEQEADQDEGEMLDEDAEEEEEDDEDEDEEDEEEDEEEEEEEEQEDEDGEYTDQGANTSVDQVVHDPLRCFICDQVGETPEMLEQHLDMHSLMLPYECKTCKVEGAPVRLVKSISSLQNHFRSHHYPFGCDICGRRFMHRRQYVTHQGNHKAKRLMCDDCEVCGDTFAGVKKLDDHRVEKHLRGKELADFLAQQITKPKRRPGVLKKANGIRYMKKTIEKRGKIHPDPTDRIHH
uniref:ZAD domain-containing protein n=1 Tax=Anopheles dirus TaxID=7168 RepID=A0A182NB54_9DIPT